MNLGIALGLGAHTFGGALPALAPFTAVAADGWQTTVASPTDLTLTPFTVSRAGFDATGTATTISDTLRLTKRVRNLYPNELTFTANSVAVSDYIYGADTVSGATNGSTVVSPKPIATWGMVDRTLVGNTINWEVIPFHRDARLGRQVVCVGVRATDGTNTTTWQYISAVTLSASCEGPGAVEVFAGAHDITALNDDSLITLQAKVFPWFGVSASVIDTSTETEARFNKRMFYKNVTRFAAPNIICVASTGNDATGVVSTNEATAAATPCLTVGGAIARASAVLGTGSRNVLSGLEIRIINAVNIGSAGGGFVNADAAGFKITRATTSTRAAANVTMNATFQPGGGGHTLGALDAVERSLMFDDMTLTMGGAFVFQGFVSAPLAVQFRNCTIAFAGFSHSSGLKDNSSTAYFGVTATGNVPMSNTVAGDNRIIRGVTVADYGGAIVDGYNVISSSFGNARIQSANAQRGALIYGNFLPNPPVNNSAIYVQSASAGQSMALAVVQNLVVRTTTSGNDINLRIAGDSDNGNIVHAVIHHNTTAGDGVIGRWNVIYDDTPGTQRTHSLISFKVNCGSQLNNKPRDTFLTTTVADGTFAFHHGVGCAGTFTEEIDASGGGLSFGQAYPGIGSVIDGGQTLFVDDRAVVLSPLTAGTTGGNYKLQGGSPARDLISQYVLTRDFEGAARATSGTIDAGAYA